MKRKWALSWRFRAGACVCLYLFFQTADQGCTDTKVHQISWTQRIGIWVLPLTKTWSVQSTCNVITNRKTRVSCKLSGLSAFLCPTNKVHVVCHQSRTILIQLLSSSGSTLNRLGSPDHHHHKPQPALRRSAALSCAKVRVGTMRN